MKAKDEYVVDLFQEEIDKRNEKEKRKIEKFKKKEEKKKKREERKLEKQEDKEFAKQQKMSRMARYSPTTKENKIDLNLLYKIFIIAIIFITLTYFIYSLIVRQIKIFNSILFTLMILSFILSSTIQKKKERKIAFIIASTLSILWMLLHI